MKNFRLYIFFSLVSISVLIPLDSFSQSQAISKAIGKGATKIVGKQSTKIAAKSTAKAVVKSVTKEEIKKESTRFALKKGAKTLGKKEAKIAIKQGAEKVVSRTVKKETKLAVVSKAKSLASIKLVKRRVSKELPYELLESSMKDAIHIGTRKLSKEAAEEVSEQLAKKLGKSSLEHWRKLIPDATSDANRVLLKDLSDNPSFRHVICGTNGNYPSPQLLESYTHCLDAPSIRTRPDMLRYLSHGADLYHEKGVYRKTFFGRGNDLRFVENNGVIEVFKNGSNKKIGKMIPNNRNGFDIEVPFDDRSLLNIYPMKNSSYTTTRQLGRNGYVKNTWVTDDVGRTWITRTEVKPDGRFVPLKRDKNAIQSIGRIKKDNTIHGQTPNRPTYINDDCGHMSALQCGGTNDNINLLPQNSSLNKGLWKSGEDAARKSINDGKTVVREVEARYPDKVDLRPSSFNVNQTINGEENIVNQFFENIIEVVK